MIDKNWMWFHDHFGKSEIHLHGITRWLAEAETPFQHIEIGISPYFGKIIVIDGDVQSSVADEYVYHECLVHPAMLAHPNPKNVLILGGGEGATLREILKHKSVERVVMCDIDRIAIDMFKQHLPEWHQGAFDDPRTELLHRDARAYLEKAANGEFDVIISDLTEPYAEVRRRDCSRLSALPKSSAFLARMASMQPSRHCSDSRPMKCTLPSKRQQKHLFRFPSHMQPTFRPTTHLGAS